MEIRDGDAKDFLFADLISGRSVEVSDHNKYPCHTEHEVILRLAGGKGNFSYGGREDGGEFLQQLGERGFEHKLQDCAF